MNINQSRRRFLLTTAAVPLAASALSALARAVGQQDADACDVVVIQEEDEAQRFHMGFPIFNLKGNRSSLRADSAYELTTFQVGDNPQCCWKEVALDEARASGATICATG